MGCVDDVRKVMQDFLAPDLKALAARLEALEREMNAGFARADKKMRTGFEHAEKMNLERFESLKNEMYKGFASAEKLSSTRQETLLATMAANYANIMNTLEMEKRLTRQESERKGEPSHA